MKGGRETWGLWLVIMGEQGEMTKKNNPTWLEVTTLQIRTLDSTTIQSTLDSN